MKALPHRRMSAMRAPESLMSIADGLDSGDRRWLLERAQRVGGINQAFVHLVRLSILIDALIGSASRVRSAQSNLIAAGLPRAEAEASAARLLDEDEVAAFAPRLNHLANWTRPGAAHVRHLYDDPALPLPHAVTQRLIREGTGRVRREQPAREAPTTMPLKGLTRLEAAWLRRKALALGGLGPTLHSLVADAREAARISQRQPTYMGGPPRRRGVPSTIEGRNGTRPAGTPKESIDGPAD